MKTKLLIGILVLIAVGAFIVAGQMVPPLERTDHPGAIYPINEFSNSPQPSLRRPWHPEVHKVDWLESPVTIKSERIGERAFEMESIVAAYKYTPAHVQIGLRDDGVVVWRKRP